MRYFLFIIAACLALAAPPKGARQTARLPLWPQNGEAVLREDLKATVEGKDAQITSLRAPTDPLLLLVVFDVAGDLSLVDPARKALIESVSALPANAYAGLLRAQDGLKVLLDPAPEREQFAEAVHAVPVSGRAGLIETVEQALLLADNVAAKTGVRVAVLYVTDSNVSNYREDFTNPVINSSDSGDLSRRFPEGLIKEKISKLLKNISVRHTPLFIVHLDYRSDRLNEAYQTGLLELASTTGGTALVCRSMAEIPAAVARSIEMIRGHYVVGLRLPDGLPASVGIEITNGTRGLNHRSRLQLSGK